MNIFAFSLFRRTNRNSMGPTGYHALNQDTIEEDNNQSTEITSVQRED